MERYEHHTETTAENRTPVMNPTNRPTQTILRPPQGRARHPMQNNQNQLGGQV
jgi:hypothetical protein